MDIGTITSQKDWDRLTNHAHAPLQQRWLYGAAAERLGRKVRRLAVYDDDRCVAVMQTVSRKIVGVEMTLASRGPLFLTDCKRKQALRDMKRALPVPSITVITPSEKLRILPLSRRLTFCEIDLTPPIENLRKTLHPKWRNALKKVEQTRLKVAKVTATSSAIMPLLQAEKDRQAKAIYRALPPEFTLVLQEVAPRSLRLFTTSNAQMLFIKHGNSATYHIGNTGPEGRVQNAHNLILWQAMIALKKEGVTRLDLGSIDQKYAPDLARFKLRTGARAFQNGAACLL
jgi:lipid II:glycine glycyltransferase (peptidoglycan interpeptide bridge formation enzyme)